MLQWLRQWFEYPADPLLLAGSYDPSLVLLSFLIAVFSSAIAIHITAQAISVKKKSLRLLMLGSGSVALGGGVWSMHFIGMLAFALCTGVSYQPGLTFLSLIPSIAASWVALDLISKKQLRSLQLLSGGVLVGAGIGTMHYMGMAAMQMSVALRYDLPMFLLSILVAVVLAIIALWVRFGLRRFNLAPHWLTLLSSVVMGAAISGMHYTGMAAARFVPPPGFTAINDSNDISWQLSLAVAFITLMITGLVVAVNLLFKYRELNWQVNAKETLARENEEKYRSLISNIPGAAYRCLHNDNWDMLFISDAVELLSGYPASDFMLPSPRRSWSDLVHPADKATTTQLDLYQGGFKLEYRIRHQDGSWRWILEHGEAIKSDSGDIIWLDGFLMDISTRKQMEQELVLAKDIAEQAAEARAAFLANMSHEIRTPMNAIIGFSDLMLSDDLAPQQHKHLQTIHSAARSLLHLLNDILDSAKLEKGKLELEYTDFSLPALLDTVVSTLWLQARKKQLQLTLELDPAAGEFYYGAPDRLRQVLTNLLGNAIKFTEHGSVRVKVQLSAPSELTFSISDTGIGISPQRLPYIFDAFTQADASMSRRFGGTGLGTTISKQLVELMGGQISVQSTEGVGSCFSFTVPLQPGVALVQHNTDRALALPALSVLITDDIVQNLELLQLMLERAGHTVVAVADGEQAVAAVQQQYFDVVLMDIQMPVMDGLEACRRIRQWEQAQQRKPLAVIALTASVLDEDKVAAKEAGMQGFASKPVDFAALTNEIARVLQLNAGTTAVVVAAEPAPLQLLNMTKALQLWGSVTHYQPQLEQFLQQQQPMLTKAAEYLQVQRFDELQKVAHAIKGVSGNLALEQLSKLCGELEQAARQQQHQRADKILQQIMQNWPQYQAACQQLQQQAGNGTAKTLQQFDDRALAALLTSLHHALQRHELDDNVLKQLEIYSGKHETLILSLLDAVNDFDFAHALAVLEQLQQHINTGQH
ncbi:PAS domain S-box-containing protein [Rheinheimera pacifica]|uniref:histidine kinase n=1 Tax=Rheinheimera pacifica TaxID=173990 RepID=A0A1H6N0C6_9GAMM|nr:MHYT domain-containing protein [Rheinheimera pacifica]SEI07988.1 PAS domain S-box-containing protein [Rheinheimera pacifica]